MNDTKDIVFYLVEPPKEHVGGSFLSSNQSKIPQWIDSGFRVFILGTSKDFDEIVKSEIIVEISRDE